MKKILIPALLFSCSALFADDLSQPVTVSQGLFFTGNVGAGSSDFPAMAGGSVSSDTFAWNVGGGYQINQYLAAEMDYLAIPAATEKWGSASIKTKTGILDFEGKLIYPFSDQLDIFGKAGFGAAFATYDYQNASGKGSKTDMVGVFGVGADYYFLSSLGVGAQFLYTTGRDSDNLPHSYTGLVGLSYRLF